MSSRGSPPLPSRRSSGANKAFKAEAGARCRTAGTSAKSDRTLTSGNVETPRNDASMARPPSCRHFRAGHSAAERQIPDQGQLREHRGGLIRRLQAVLNRQQFARHLIGGNILGLIDHVLHHCLGLGLPGGGGLYFSLRVGEVGLDVGNALLTWLWGQVRCNALAQGTDLRGGIGSRRRGLEGGKYRDVLQLGANRLLIGLGSEIDRLR